MDFRIFPDYRVKIRLFPIAHDQIDGATGDQADAGAGNSIVQPKNQAGQEPGYRANGNPVTAFHGR